MDFHLGRTFVFIRPTGIGKSNFDLSHFSRPLHVTCRQDFDKCDGVVIDDVVLHNRDPEEVIQLIDLQFTTSINVKYGMGILKAGFPRITYTNGLEMFSMAGIAKICHRKKMS